MTDAAAVAYNPFEPGFAENPYPQYEAMRRYEPVHQSPFGIWLLFRYDDVLRFLRDPSLSVEEARAKPTVLDQFADEVLGTDRDRDLGTTAMPNRAPPDHRRDQVEARASLRRPAVGTHRRRGERRHALRRGAPRAGDAALHRRPRDDGEPHRQRHPRPAPQSRSAREAARRPVARRRGHRGAPALRRACTDVAARD